MKIMPSCKDITEHSSDYLDRNLSFKERLGFRVHLFLCVSCRRYLSQLKLTIATIGKTENAAPQPVNEQHVQDIVENLKQKVEQEN